MTVSPPTPRGQKMPSITWVLPPPALMRRGLRSGTVGLPTVLGVARAPLTAALGMTPDGDALALNLAQLPHLAIVGTSGSGKSNLIHAILTSLLSVATPDDLQLLLADITGELGDYAGIPHLAEPPLNDADEALVALERLGQEMERRYDLFHERNVRDLDEYNAVPGQSLPRLLVVVDEFAEVMLGSDRRRVERAVSKVGIRGRKVGIHLLVATQVPHATVLTPAIKANMIGRIALAVPSAVFSRVAVDEGGAQDLRGRGDGLLRDGETIGLQRFQTAYVPRKVVEGVVAHWCHQAPTVALQPATTTPRDPVRTRPVPVSPPRRRLPLWPLLAALFIALVIAFGSQVGTGTKQCTQGTYTDTTLVQYCAGPGDRTICVLSTLGYTPRPDGNPNDTVARKAPTGPWCPDAGRTSP